MESHSVCPIMLRAPERCLPGTVPVKFCTKWPEAGNDLSGLPLLWLGVAATRPAAPKGCRTRQCGQETTRCRSKHHTSGSFFQNRPDTARCLSCNERIPLFPADENGATYPVPVE